MLTEDHGPQKCLEMLMYRTNAYRALSAKKVVENFTQENEVDGETFD
jgi:hypothetical protein